MQESPAAVRLQSYYMGSWAAKRPKGMADVMVRKRDGWGWGRVMGGWALLIVGAAGMLLPILPGLPLILAGLAMLSCEYVWARDARNRLDAFAKQLKRKWKAW
jgi:hypothetical protein